MKTFLRLKNGPIVYVTQVNELYNVITGFNLDSPHLREKSFSFDRVDHNWYPTYKEIRDRCDATHRSDKECRFHSGDTTAKRTKLVSNLVYGVLQWEINKSNVSTNGCEVY